MKRTFKLFYKTGKTEKEISKLKLVEKHGKHDWISKFFEKHLEKIFPKLELIILDRDKKYPTEYPFLRKSLDALCWYPEGKSFIIFEYKSELKPRLASG